MYGNGMTTGPLKYYLVHFEMLCIFHILLLPCMCRTSLNRSLLYYDDWGDVHLLMFELFWGELVFMAFFKSSPCLTYVIFIGVTACHFMNSRFFIQTQKIGFCVGVFYINCWWSGRIQ